MIKEHVVSLRRNGFSEDGTCREIKLEYNKVRNIAQTTVNMQLINAAAQEINVECCLEESCTL